MLPVALAACINDPTEPDPWQLEDSDGTVALRFYAQFPEPSAGTTRTWAEEPAYGNLDLYCVVFDDGGHPSRNYLTQVKPAICHPENLSQTTLENGEEVTIVPFEVELESISEEDAIIHFIAIDKSVAKEDNPLLDKDKLYGPENVVMPRMIVSDGHDAYWQRIKLGMPIKNGNKDEIAKFVSKTSPVPLIRNFAKISVDVDRDKVSEDLFELKGFCVINTLDCGTIAPYSELLPDGFPQFVNFDDNRKPYNYDQIINTGYKGMRASGSKVVNPGVVPADTNDADTPYTPDAKYLYERPFSESNHTYIIVKGQYKGDGGSGEDTYYKLDIGTANSEFGIFEFSNLLRNFDFKIRITAVSADGYATTEDAAKGLIYNNNISAALETQHLLSISNGIDMMYVSFTSYVIVKQEDNLELLYRYFNLGNGETIDDSRQEFGVVGIQYGEGTGEVIAEAELLEGEENRRSEDIMQGTTPITRVWEVLKIKTKEPGPELKYQTITLYKSNGLSRTIKFYMQEPWKLKNPVTYGAQLDHREETPTVGSKEEQWPNHISRHAGENLTIFFELPDNLPKAMFPLEFTIESNRQNIENDKVGTIAVTSGESMFVPGEIRIQYVKTVRWEEYDPDNDNRDENGQSPESGDNYDENGEYIGKRVRCRFLTISDLNDPTITQDVTQVKIRNKYFEDLNIVFYRDLEDL